MCIVLHSSSISAVGSKEALKAINIVMFFRRKWCVRTEKTLSRWTSLGACNILGPTIKGKTGHSKGPDWGRTHTFFVVSVQLSGSSWNISSSLCTSLFYRVSPRVLDSQTGQDWGDGLWWYGWVVHRWPYHISMVSIWNHWLPWYFLKTKIIVSAQTIIWFSKYLLIEKTNDPDYFGSW